MNMRNIQNKTTQKHANIIDMHTIYSKISDVQNMACTAICSKTRKHVKIFKISDGRVAEMTWSLKSRQKYEDTLPVPLRYRIAVNQNIRNSQPNVTCFAGLSESDRRSVTNGEQEAF